MTMLVFSRTLRQCDYPEITILAEIDNRLATLREQSGKDMCLFGGGLLFRSFLQAELVDTGEVAIMPVLLGRGVPFLLSFGKTTKLFLKGQKIYKTGVVSLTYRSPACMGRNRVLRFLFQFLILLKTGF